MACKGVTTDTANEMAAPRSQDSFLERLDGRGSPFLETFEAVLMDAKEVIRMTCTTSEWSLLLSEPGGS